jgi:hypothetical protein
MPTSMARIYFFVAFNEDKKRLSTEGLHSILHELHRHHRLFFRVPMHGARPTAMKGRWSEFSLWRC